MAKISVPYVYALTWTSLGVSYIGCRYAKGCSPNDLWNRYFTSSSVVKSYREKYGDPDTIDIIRSYQETSECSLDEVAKDCLAFESSLLEMFDAKNNDSFLNLTNGAKDTITHGRRYKSAKHGKDNNFFGKKHTEKTRKRLSSLRTGSKMGTETKNKISNTLKGNPSTRWWNNGVETFRGDNPPNPSWKRGRGNIRHWTNGTESRRQAVCPGEGWFIGRPKTPSLSIAKSGSNNPAYGKKWWNDGNRNLLSATKPDGDMWTKGMKRN